MFELEDHMNKEMLRYAVQRAISCRCGNILDTRKSVHFYMISKGKKFPFVRCFACYDEARELATDIGALAMIVDILDARELWPAVATCAEPPVRNAFRKRDVVIGAVYIVKVGAKLRRCRIDSVCRPEPGYGVGGYAGKGWNATNLETGRTLQIATAARLRSLVSPVKTVTQ